jgi:RHS repeat-associated protein
VAVRQGGTLHYLLGDHPGSTSITADENDGKEDELRYKAYGEARDDDVTGDHTPTSFRFTGQREDDTIGLYFYNARYYDPALGRFVQADTIVPSPADPQSLNRYSYVNNNP